MKEKEQEHIIEKAMEFDQLDTTTQNVLEAAVSLVKAIKAKKGEELDANSERSGGVNPRREEA